MGSGSRLLLIVNRCFVSHAHMETHNLPRLRIHVKDSEVLVRCRGLGIGIDLPAIGNCLRYDKDDWFGVNVLQQVGLLRDAHVCMPDDAIYFLRGYMAGAVHAHAIEVANVWIVLQLTRIGG